MVKFRSKLPKLKPSVLRYKLMKTDLIFIQYPKLLMWKALSLIYIPLYAVSPQPKILSDES